MPYHPTLRQMGYRTCGHYHDPARIDVPLLGWSGPVRGPHWRCRFCGALWSHKGRCWIGGSIDWPQDVIEIPTTEEMAAIYAARENNNG